MHPTYTANPEVFNAFTGQADVVAYMYLRFKFWLPEVTTLFDWEFLNGVLAMTLTWGFNESSNFDEGNSRKYKFTLTEDWAS
jgi:hypothetical protein